jgi:hypothetical protein
MIPVTTSRPALPARAADNPRPKRAVLASTVASRRPGRLERPSKDERRDAPRTRKGARGSGRRPPSWMELDSAGGAAVSLADAGARRASVARRRAPAARPKRARVEASRRSLLERSSGIASGVRRVLRRSGSSNSIASGASIPAADRWFVGKRKRARWAFSAPGRPARARCRSAIAPRVRRGP